MPFISLPSKPNSPLSYEFIDNRSTLLVVFINGLGLPASSWTSTIKILQDQALPITNNLQQPNFLTYDRFGQGATTSRDPADARPDREDGYGHDLNDVVSDLEELVKTLTGGDAAQLIFTSASIGVHIARLFDQRFPGRIVAHLMLDSNMGNIGLTELLPDPEAPGFDPASVIAEDCTLEQYCMAFERARIIFDASSKNAEGLDRRNIRDLLPLSSGPSLSDTSKGRQPWLTVVGHDKTRFEEEQARLLKVPISITRRYIQP
ncbi:hypothetical protein PWT90_03667 [Aphanocladium album]|nr:hypothetical protein PWT90_03667 [Aphanocladium album]